MAQLSVQSAGRKAIHSKWIRLPPVPASLIQILAGHFTSEGFECLSVSSKIQGLPLSSFHSPPLQKRLSVSGDLDQCCRAAR